MKKEQNGFCKLRMQTYRPKFETSFLYVSSVSRRTKVR